MRVDGLVVRTSEGTRRLSLDVAPGGFATLVATPPVCQAFARTIAGLADPVAGRVLVAGQDVTGQPPDRRHLAYLPAGGALLPHLTIQENIEDALRRRDLVHKLADERLDLLLQVLGLLPAAQLYPHQLAPRRRLHAALARALATAPEVMVIDLSPSVSGGDDLPAQPSPRDVAAVPDLVRACTPPNTAGVAVLACVQDPDLPGSGIVQVRPEEVPGCS